MRVSDPRSTYEVFYTAHPLGFLYTSSELGKHTVMLRRPLSGGKAEVVGCY